MIMRFPANWTSSGIYGDTMSSKMILGITARITYELKIHPPNDYDVLLTS